MTDTEKCYPALPWYRRPGGVLFIHTLRMVLLAFIAGPLAASFTLLMGKPLYALPASLLAGLLFGGLSAAGAKLPPSAVRRYILPLFFCWIMGVAFFPFIFIMAFDGGALTAMRFLPAMYALGLLPGFVFFERRRRDRVRFDLSGWAAFCLLLLIPLGYMAHGTYRDMTYAAKRGHGFESVGGFSSTDLKPYDPRVPESVTPRLDEPSTFAITGTEGLPALDGAEAAFPVYAAFAAACYPDMPPLSDEDSRLYNYQGIKKGPLLFTNTIFGFAGLLDGKVDIFFGAHPSKRQMEHAGERGKELVLTPIGREGFVFFVNEANPVNGLASEQIRGIYSGNIRNWKKLGGQDAEIIAFQRPEDSGSQTVMHQFMGGTRMEPPLQDRRVGGMGGIVERTSTYRNAPSALGYSFRFFLTGMGKQPRIRMLAVDGVAPTAGTIMSGQYPHTVNLYAITVKDNPNPRIAPFLEWMQGPQGQELVEKVGYVKIPPSR